MEPVEFLAVGEDVSVDRHVWHRGSPVGEGAFQSNTHRVGLHGGTGGLGGAGSKRTGGVPVRDVALERARPLAEDGGRGGDARRAGRVVSRLVGAFEQEV